MFDNSRLELTYERIVDPEDKKEPVHISKGCKKKLKKMQTPNLALQLMTLLAPSGSNVTPVKKMTLN